SDALSRKTAWGVFDQATFKLTDRLGFTGGVRYSSESQFVAAFQSTFCPISVLPNETVVSLNKLPSLPAGCFPVPFPSGQGSWSDVTWKAGFEFNVSERTLAYLSATTGFKSGGVQPGQPPPLPSTFKPETVINYEGGVKTRLLDEALIFRAAV